MKDSYENGTELLFCSTCFVRDFDENTVEYSNPALTNFLKKSSLKLFQQNINGILKNVDRIKILLNGTKQNIHILGISQTHTNNTITNAELSIDGYTIESKDRQNGVFGGVLCYIRSDVNYIRRDQNSSGKIKIYIILYHV